MAQISKSKTWVDTEAVYAADLNQNFDDIYNEFNGSITADNLSDNAVTAAKITAGAVTPVKGPDLAKIVNRKDNNTNNTVSNQLIQYGWGFIAGTGAAYASETVTFPVAYDTAPIVTVTGLGRKDGSDPAAITEFNLDTDTIPHLFNISTTGFSVTIESMSATAMPSGRRLGYSWIAIGTKARS